MAVKLSQPLLQVVPSNPKWKKTTIAVVDEDWTITPTTITTHVPAYSSVYGGDCWDRHCLDARCFIRLRDTTLESDQEIAVWAFSWQHYNNGVHHHVHSLVEVNSIFMSKESV